ncbi:MAG: transcriptional regulator GlxA family with amidase domain [Shewanella sp.]|jgi:transcriptional regulator GlxA family with amidase domain
MDQLAEKALMSRRNFSRQFRKTMGTTAAHWLLMQRLTRAQKLLETSTKNIDNVAIDSGFTSTVSFRQHFCSVLAISPSAYRKKFKMNAPLD